jgi:hypothetical protein
LTSNPLLEIDDIPADTVTVDTDNQITAVWNKGVPIRTNENILLAFKQDEPYLYYKADTSSFTFSNNLEISSSSSGIQCSFAGGCKYEITASGLASSLKKDKATKFISICDNKCEYLDSESDSEKTVCILPKLVTQMSI